MALCPFAEWNPSPESCYTRRRSRKIAVCDHRTVGYIGYLRNFDHLKENPPRRISAMFTVAMDGSIQQHVDTDYIAWTQGIMTKHHEYARARWSLFQGRNPNIDCIGIEHEDGGKAFTSKRPMSDNQLEASVRLHKWLFEEVLDATPELGVNLISHDQLTPHRHQDPGDWVMETLSNRLAIKSPPLLPGQAKYHETPSPGVGILQEQISSLEQRIAELESKSHSIHETTAT